MIDERKVTRYIKTEINPYGKPFDGTVFEFGNMLIDYMERMEKEPERKWIPVSERLPDDNSIAVVLACDDNEDINVVSGALVNDIDMGIVAWQPLPEPYKGGVRKNDTTGSN